MKNKIESLFIVVWRLKFTCAKGKTMSLCFMNDLTGEEEDVSMPILNY